jgi:hypothetical protein
MLYISKVYGAERMIGKAFWLWQNSRNFPTDKIRPSNFFFALGYLIFQISIYSLLHLLADFLSWENLYNPEKQVCRFFDPLVTLS